jgi:predicted DNA-binding transcriptional regulator YafY
VQFESVVSSGGNEHLPMILEAIRGKKMLWFIYASFVKGIEKPRKVSPLFLKEYRNRWYLICFDKLKNDIITYALDRMQEPKILEDEASLPIDFEPELYFQDTIGITSYKGKAERIVFKANPIAAKYISSQPFHQSQKLTSETAEFSVFELTVLVSEEFVRNLLGYAGELEVLEPKSLRKDMADRAKQLNKLYESK